MKSKFFSMFAMTAIAIASATSVQAAVPIVTIWDDLFIQTLATTTANPATGTPGSAPDAGWTSSVALPGGNYTHEYVLELGVAVQIAGFLWANAADFDGDSGSFGAFPAELLNAPVAESLGSPPPVGVELTASDVTITIDANGFGNMNLANISLGTLAQFGNSPISGLRVGVVGIGGSVVTPGRITITSTPFVVPEPTSGLFLASLATGVCSVVRRRRK